MKLSDRAILLSLRISQWSGKATEKNGAREIEQSKGAKSGVVSARKVLMPDFPELIEIQKYNTAFRTWFNEKTLEYGPGGRLAPIVTAQELLQEAGQKIEAGMKLAEAVAMAYPDHLDKAESNLGDLFERRLYPTSAEILTKFSYRLTPGTVPESDTLRNCPGFSQEEVDQMVGLAKESERTFYQEAMRDVWQRIYDATSRMNERLSIPLGKGVRTHETVLTDVQELVDALPALNIFGDPEIDKMAQAMKIELSGGTIETLKTDQHARNERAAKAKALAEKAKNYLF